MKRNLCFFIIGICIAAMLCSCNGENMPSTNTEKITNKKIPIEDVTEFYYTYENINFNAHYQRYHFYVEEGKYMFHHEMREKPNEYGWTTEEDITKSGTFELTQEEWSELMDLLKNGTVSKRKESEETGDSGPWTYIYWKGDADENQVFQFANYDDLTAFEDFCINLASK